MRNIIIMINENKEVIKHTYVWCYFHCVGARPTYSDYAAYVVMVVADALVSIWRQAISNHHADSTVTIVSYKPTILPNIHIELKHTETMPRRGPQTAGLFLVGTLVLSQWRRTIYSASLWHNEALPCQQCCNNGPGLGQNWADAATTAV